MSPLTLSLPCFVCLVHLGPAPLFDIFHSLFLNPHHLPHIHATVCWLSPAFLAALSPCRMYLMPYFTLHHFLLTSKYCRCKWISPLLFIISFCLSYSNFSSWKGYLCISWDTMTQVIFGFNTCFAKEILLLLQALNFL